MPHLAVLTGIRAVAFFWVFLYHAVQLDYVNTLDWGLLAPVIAKGYLGVDLFFLLSGFIIAYNYQDKLLNTDKSGIFRYLFLRFARIYPVHGCMLLITALFYLTKVYGLHQAISEPERYTALQFIYNLLNIHGWGISAVTSWNRVSWSVSCEWFAYLIFPLCVGFFAKARPLRQTLLWIAAFMAIFAVTYYLTGSSTVDWTADFGLIRILVEFPVGCLLYTLYRHDETPRLDWNPVLAGTAITLLVGLMAGWNDVLIIALLALGLYGLAQAHGPVHRLLGSRPMVHLGEVSYSLYMVHGFIAYLLGSGLKPLNLEPGWPTGIGVIASYLVLSWLAGECMFHRVETPAREMLKRWMHKQPWGRNAPKPPAIQYRSKAPLRCEGL